MTTMKLNISIPDDFRQLLCECHDAIDKGLLYKNVPIEEEAGLIKPVRFTDAMIHIMANRESTSLLSRPNLTEVLDRTLNLCKTAKILSNDPRATLVVKTHSCTYNAVYDMTNLIHDHIKVGENQ